LCPRVELEHVAVYVVSILYNTRHLAETTTIPGVLVATQVIATERRHVPTG
jgi:hypothetical protein